MDLPSINQFVLDGVVNKFILAHLGLSQQWPRWTAGQIYVSDADGDLVKQNSLKKNKKNGTTISVLKRGGWSDSFALAKLIGSWPA